MVQSGMEFGMVQGFERLDELSAPGPGGLMTTVSLEQTDA